jgi:precorrin-4 methylase
MKTMLKKPLLCLLFVAALFSTGFAKTGLPASTKLFLVGMGPGDMDLTTLRAVNVIKAADIVVCFEKSEKKYGEFIKGKKIIAVPHGFWFNYGKKTSELKGEELTKEGDISAKRDKFIRQVREAVKVGKVVAVLDSGDPMVYGPWSWILEEFEDLKPNVVPGLSCFNAANAALKKSPTSSRNTKSVILSANDWPGKADTIEKLGKSGSSMALFTMRAEFDYFINSLKASYPSDTPVAIVMNAGYKDKEKVVTGTLGDITDKMKEVKRPFEYMIYIGDFITYRHKSE